MTVSVVIPAYDAARYLPLTVPAVLALDGVSEWIWVDDGSTDDTRSELARLTRGHERVRVLHHDRNRGRAAARNTGAQAATGTVIACLDADSRPRAGYAHAHLEALGRPGAIASIGRIEPADAVEGDPYGVYLQNRSRGPRVRSGPTSWAHFVTCAACVRADALERAGAFDPRIRYGEDAELACRLAATDADGLHVAGEAIVDLFGTERLSGALEKTRAFGASLPQILASCPDALDVLGLARLDHRGVRALLQNDRLARWVTRRLPRLPAALVATGVRYLLGHALYGGYTDALEGLSPDP